MMRFFLSLALLVFVTACGNQGYSPYGGTPEPTQVKIGKPYAVKGETYYPKYEPSYTETGIASWYGPDFHARMTASGEQYDQNEMTAAHKTLPMPSMVRVTREDNGKSVIVRVNDRGPFVKGRVIDLSKAAAEAIGLDKDGITRVRVEYLPGESDDFIASKGLRAPWWDGQKTPVATVARAEVGGVSSADLPPPAGMAPTPLMADELPPVQPAVEPVKNKVSAEINPEAQPKPAALDLSYLSPSATNPQSSAARETAGATYRVQTGSFSIYENAEKHADAIADFASPEIHETMVSGTKFYRVSLGPVHDLAAAQAILNRVKENGHEGARLIVE